MRRLLDIMRLVVISPELVLALAPLVILTYAPELADPLLKPMKESLVFGLSAAGVPIAMVIWSYNVGSDLLSPLGARKILLEWPGYAMLKDRVLACWIWCVVGVAACLLAAFMVANDLHPRLAIAVLAGGILEAAMATATLALAKVKAREILGE